MSAFAAKNADRRAGRARVTHRSYVEARHLRQACRPVPGAFGRRPATVWNALVVGTTGDPRVERRSVKDDET